MNMSPESKPRILMVDDEPNILQGYTRTLRSFFEVVTATSGAAGLDMLRQQSTFAVVVSDLRMPQMDGVAFLHHAREIAPDATRILFTGNPDLESAISAVNDGAIFRFVTKPCSLEILRKTLQAAAGQHRLVTAERVLLEQTLRGSVKTLTDILALVNPSAFGRAARARSEINRLMDAANIQERWPVEVAAMLSQIGSVTLPSHTSEKLYQGESLSEDELAMVNRLPGVVEDLLANIPRLDSVRQILRYERKNYDGSGSPHDEVHGGEIPWGARALRVTLDLDVLETQKTPLPIALATLRGRKGCYDPTILESLADVRGGVLETGESTVEEVPADGLRTGMVLAEDVKTLKGLLLVARGQEVTIGLIERLRNFSSQVGVKEPIRVLVREKGSPSPGTVG